MECNKDVCMNACTHVRTVRARARVCVCVCVCARARACLHVCTTTDTDNTNTTDDKKIAYNHFDDRSLTLSIDDDSDILKSYQNVSHNIRDDLTH
jgi:hypothetical protein